MCQQSMLSKTVKLISIVTLSAIALGSVLNNASSAMNWDRFEDLRGTILTFKCPLETLRQHM